LVLPIEIGDGDGEGEVGQQRQIPGKIKVVKKLDEPVVLKTML
jgi:hypothetical protein